jgi:NAD(P)-dependent dehydrogenase (short-subunit alcohol dehydrogenase family)
MSLSEKIILVSGGTGGLGRAVSLAFLNAGSQIIATYVHENEFAELKNLAGANASRLSGRQLDVTDEAAVQRVIDQIVADHGRLDVLVNTVGGYAGGKKMWESDSATLERMLSLNLRSGYVLARAAVRAMLPRASGSIVNVAAKAALDHPATLADYAASKAAALAMIDSLAADLRGTGIRANTVLPSILDTDTNRRAMPQADFSAWPKPEAIARVILFLASDDAEVVHGAAIPVYGNR